MTDIVLVGAGGHARVCAEVLQSVGHRIVGCVARDAPASGAGAPPSLGPYLGPYLGTDDDLEDVVAAGLMASGTATVFVGVGDSADRLALAERVRRAGGDLVSAVSPHAVVSPSAFVGPGTLLMPGAVVNAGTVLGTAVVVNTNASVDHDCVVGSGVHVAPGCAIAGGVELGEGVFMGIGSCVVPGVRIGAWAIVGAGAVVLRDVDAGSTVSGVPARAHPLRPAPHRPARGGGAGC